MHITDRTKGDTSDKGEAIRMMVGALGVAVEASLSVYINLKDKHELMARAIDPGVVVNDFAEFIKEASDSASKETKRTYEKITGKKFETVRTDA